MARILTGLMLLLPLLAAHAEVTNAAAPAETSASFGTIVFVVLFVGICIGFVWMVVRNDKKQKEQPKQES